MVRGGAGIALMPRRSLGPSARSWARGCGHPWPPPPRVTQTAGDSPKSRRFTPGNRTSAQDLRGFGERVRATARAWVAEAPGGHRCSRATARAVALAQVDTISLGIGAGSRGSPGPASPKPQEIHENRGDVLPETGHGRWISEVLVKAGGRLRGCGWPKRRVTGQPDGCAGGAREKQAPEPATDLPRSRDRPGPAPATDAPQHSRQACPAAGSGSASQIPADRIR